MLKFSYMEQEQIPIEVKYVSLEPTEAERLKVEKIINEQPGNWAETFAGLPTDLQERIRIDPEYCPTDAVLDASLQNHGYGLPPEVRSRMYEDFARFLSDCGIPQDAPDYPYTPLAKQFLDNRIETPMIISPVEPEEPPHPDTSSPAEPEIDIWGEAGEPAPESPPGITKPQELQRVEVIEQPEPVVPVGGLEAPTLLGEQSPFSPLETLTSNKFTQIVLIEYSPQQHLSPIGIRWVEEPKQGTLLVLKRVTPEGSSMLKSWEKDQLLQLNNLFSEGDSSRPVRIVGDGRDENNLPYLVLEYISPEFKKLAEYIRDQKTLSVVEVLQVTTGLCETLNKLHGAGLIRPPLSSDDIFFDPATNRIRLVSWNSVMPISEEEQDLANFAQDRTRLTAFVANLLRFRISAEERKMAMPIIQLLVDRFQQEGESNLPLQAEPTQELLNMLRDSSQKIMDELEAKERDFNIIQKKSRMSEEKEVVIPYDRDSNCFVKPDGERIPATSFVGRDGRIIRARLLKTQGVYGDVYFGRYDGEERDSVAVKMAKYWKKDSIGDKSLSSNEEFSREARALEQLQHAGSTHTLKVHNLHLGTGPADLPYFVMDLARGKYSSMLVYAGSNFREVYYLLRGEIVGRNVEELTALEITHQFVETVEASQKAGFHNRELGKEMFWDYERRHLTVIDWGGIEPTSETNQKIELQKAIALLRNLLRGDNSQIDFNLLLEEQAGGEVLAAITTPGALAIIRKALNPDENKSYASLAEFKADLEKQLAVLGGLGTPEPAR